MSQTAVHRPRKRFGQNFLHDRGILARMVAAIAPRAGDHLVEIGPGLGALTEPLLQHLDALDVVELDRDLIPHLQSLAGPDRLHIHQADALRFDFTVLADKPGSLRVVGNLPYNISTPLIFHLLENAPLIHDMHFLLQKEVVDRLAAAPGGKDYGRLSVMVQYACEVESLFRVPPGAFTPPPKVDSAFVRLTPYPEPPWRAIDPALLSRLVNQAFTQRRKTLRNAVKGLADSTDIEAAGLDPTQRPETLSVADYVRLANRLTDRPPEDA
ncbi:MAG: 16S rRNA (adenine(1518)-N(6)/adenine(1519)-N(6))-dimethyltransferase RsmA [Gammaproteobacteria bacterium]